MKTEKEIRQAGANLVLFARAVQADGDTKDAGDIALAASVVAWVLEFDNPSARAFQAVLDQLQEERLESSRRN